MPGGALMAGASLGSAVIGSNAANKAAKMQAAAAAQARQDQLPFMRVGQGAAASLAQLYGIDPNTGQFTGQPFNPAALEHFRSSPDYQFAFDEGQRAVEFSNAGRGLLRSGNNLRDLTSFGQGLATQTFGNYRSSLQQLMALGQGAASGAGNAAMQQGAAQASGTIGAANAWGGALGNLGNYFMLSNLIGQQRGGNPAFGSLSAYAPPVPSVGVLGNPWTVGGVGAAPY